MRSIYIYIYDISSLRVKRQVINLRSCCIWLVESVDLWWCTDLQTLNLKELRSFRTSEILIIDSMESQHAAICDYNKWTFTQTTSYSEDILLYSGKRQHVTYQTFNAVVTESIAFTSSSNTEESRFLRNVGIYLGEYAALHYSMLKCHGRENFNSCIFKPPPPKRKFLPVHSLKEYMGIEV